MWVISDAWYGISAIAGPVSLAGLPGPSAGGALPHIRAVALVFLMAPCPCGVAR